MDLNPGKTRPGIKRPSAAKAASPRSARRAPSRRAPDPRLAHLSKLAVEWKIQLEQCLKASHVETVHRVRTGTRRLEAMIEVLVQEAPEENSEFDAAAARWRRQLKRIRRAAAPVRDLDVHRKLLEKYTFKEISPADTTQPRGKIAVTTPQAASAVESQAEKLDAWLRHAREHHAAELIKQITKRLDRVDGLIAAFTAAWASLRGRKKPIQNAARSALDLFVELSDRMPLLDTANLHEFRIGAKKARYVTEVGGGGPQAEANGKAIKRVQDVIGEWHDWLSLADEARIALGEEGSPLSELLGAEVERSFQQAKRVTERMRGKLAGEWQALQRR